VYERVLSMVLGVTVSVGAELTSDG
jgi:hypothetical protein